MNKLRQVMAALRDPENGCPWDLQQTFESLVPHTLEEAYEVADTIESNNLPALCDELGDLLFQVIFYARLAEERGLFRLEDVENGIVDKLTRRHPHVFADAKVTDAEAQTRAWEAHKANERVSKTGQSGALAGVALALPALSRAAKLQRRAARVGFDWPDVAPIFDKVEEELQEVREEIEGNRHQSLVEEEMGDLLFACVNLARFSNIDPESALRKANEKFSRRFAHMEKTSQQPLNELSLDALNDLWDDAKRTEAKPGT